MSAPVTVTAADREAAAAYWKVSRIGNAGTQRRYLSGEADASFIVQAFARHRLQAEASFREREAEYQAGQAVTYIGADGSWNLRCTIVENVEGWWLVRFSDHSEINPSEAIVRPSALLARATAPDAGGVER